MPKSWWYICYGDGTIFSNEDGAWEDAPGYDAQVILFLGPAGDWQMRHGGSGGSRCDYFRLDEDGSVVGMDEDGMKAHVVHDLGIVKQGKMLSSYRWNKIRQRAKEMLVELRAR